MDAVEQVTFGMLLRRYRVAAGLSQEELAERARMSVRGLSDLKRGVRRTPYRGTVTQLAEALELSAEERDALKHEPSLLATRFGGPNRATDGTGAGRAPAVGGRPDDAGFGGRRAYS